MAQSVSRIRCPNCQNPLQAQVTQLVDVQEDPSAKARLLSGALNQISCPHCGYAGQLATPLVYHDPGKELLLTYIPAEVALERDDQEKIVGGLINRVMERLPAQERKAYLLQPQSVLTQQGMIERILEADGVSKEDLEEQRAKMRLFDQLMRTTDAALDEFVEQHDPEFDEQFFQLASMAIQSMGNREAQTAAAQRLEAALEKSSLGKEVQTQQEELRAAAQDLQDLGEQLTREKLLELIVGAPTDQRVVALVNLARPVFDYSFFQLLSEKIDAAEGDEAARLSKLRERVLEVTQQIDEAQQARAAQSAAVLRSIMDADDMDEAILSALPLVDDLFVGTLHANIAAARERGDEESEQKLRQIERRLSEIVRESLPPSLALAQDVLEIEDEEQAKAKLSESSELIDEDFLSTLMSAANRLESGGRGEAADRVRRLHKHALGLSMRNKMRRKEGSAAGSGQETA